MKFFKIWGLCRLSAACTRFENDCVHQETLTLNEILLQWKLSRLSSGKKKNILTFNAALLR